MKNTHKHKWQAYGGCDTNPGCFDRGNGNMIFVSHCAGCGKIKVFGTNYAGQGSDWKHVYASVDEYLRELWPEDYRRTKAAQAPRAS